MKKRLFLSICCFFLMFKPGASNCSSDDTLRRNIRLPSGFAIEIYADNVPNARSMALGDHNILYVGTRKAGKVYAVVDRNEDFTADEVITIAEGLNLPNGVAFDHGDLYVAEVNRIIKFPDIVQRLHNPGRPEVIFDDLPDRKWHGLKFIKFGPDGKLYIPIGSPCNVCEPGNQPFGTITRINKDGSGFEIFARGIRNSVGFDWHPETGELWFTDNGRDYLGDDLPPDELNHAPRSGLHFGFPYLHGVGILDPEFGDRAAGTVLTKPAQELGSHVAALGMQFYTGNMFPDEYRNRVFIAEHGSWNRSEPTGYRISMVSLENNKPVSYEVFAQGWLQKNRKLGRPVDLEIMDDGSLLVSDDYSGRIYRIFYRKTPWVP